jgi:hypothetical protein
MMRGFGHRVRSLLEHAALDDLTAWRPVCWALRLRITLDEFVQLSLDRASRAGDDWMQGGAG